ncbi:hypothetical protein BLA29_005348 [Euroglyphus maynei]|uniref:Uncharacterized protein n=1 Tax=Euroglyphus maynei TaxID=6958 RepID=A0A1Y3B186_EURMA|nr:hypothetical protein BLA29_005348 [Euroglyphus maynei]
MYWRWPVLTDQDLNRIDITNYFLQPQQQQSTDKHLFSSLFIFTLIITATMIRDQMSSRSSYYFLITSFILTYLYRSYMKQSMAKFLSTNYLHSGHVHHI